MILVPLVSRCPLKSNVKKKIKAALFLACPVDLNHAAAEDPVKEHLSVRACQLTKKHYHQDSKLKPSDALIRN